MNENIGDWRKGFVGRNLCAELKNRGFTDLYEYDLDTNPALLGEYAHDCEFVFHLAGVNRLRILRIL